MPHINVLKKRARESAAVRGHVLEPFTPGRRVWFSQCERCGARAVVIPNPHPHHVPIGGRAFAVHCH